MLKRSLFALAAVAVLGVGSDVRASPVLFTYASTPAPLVTVEPTTTVTYTGAGNISDANPVTDIAVGEIFLSSPTGDGAVDSGPITWTIDITDADSGDVGSFELTSLLQGTVTPDSSNFTNVEWTGSSSQQIGNFIYTVTAKLINVPTVAVGGTTTPGSLSATVTVEPAVIPEPSTVAMAGLGGLGLVGTVLRRRRKLS